MSWKIAKCVIAALEDSSASNHLRQLDVESSHTLKPWIKHSNNVLCILCLVHRWCSVLVKLIYDKSARGAP